MSTLRPRGPLPAAVYWRRRILVLGVALLLVVGLAWLLNLGSDGSSKGTDRAALADAETSASAAAGGATSGAATPAATPSATPTPTSTPTPTPTLAAPTGKCDDSDVAVTPEVTSAVAGPKHGVQVRLSLRTVESPACTWRVSARSLTLKITSGRDKIWSTLECPRAIPAQDVVVRNNASSTVDLTWNGRRSDEECSRDTAWALPGFYHLNAAALAGEPADVQFELAAPTAPTVTRTPEPKPTAKDKKTAKKAKRTERAER